MPLANCSICMSSMDTSGSPQKGVRDLQHVVSLPCGHVFHEGCVGPWLQKAVKCPSCRASPEESRKAQQALKGAAKHMCRLYIQGDGQFEDRIKREIAESHGSASDLLIQKVTELAHLNDVFEDQRKRFEDLERHAAQEHVKTKQFYEAAVALEQQLKVETNKVSAALSANKDLSSRLISTETALKGSQLKVKQLQEKQAAHDAFEELQDSDPGQALDRMERHVRPDRLLPEYRKLLAWNVASKKRSDRSLEAVQQELTQLRRGGDTRVNLLEKQVKQLKQMLEDSEARRLEAELRMAHDTTKPGDSGSVKKDRALQEQVLPKEALAHEIDDLHGGPDEDSGCDERRRVSLSEAETPVRAFPPHKSAAAPRPGVAIRMSGTTRPGSLLPQSASRSSIRSNDPNLGAKFVRTGTDQMGMPVNVPYTASEWGRPASSTVGVKRPPSGSMTQVFAPAKKPSTGTIASFFGKK